MLIFYNYAFHALHLAVIGLNLFGWTVPRLRVVTFLMQLITIGCWVGFGVVKDWWGYCPLTDWHWEVLAALGNEPAQNNYIAYILAQWAGLYLPNAMVQGLIIGSFTMAVLANSYILTQSSIGYNSENIKMKNGRGK